MGKVELDGKDFQKWVEDHVIESRYVVFFGYSGSRATFWVLPTTKAWQFAEVDLTDTDSRTKLEQLLSEKGVKFFNAEVEWKLRKVRFWSWKELKSFSKYYLGLPKKDYEVYLTASEEIIFLPKVSSGNLINFCIQITRANKPEEQPATFLSELKIPVYPVKKYTWNADTAQAVSTN
jgi:hypothetical protein